MYMDDMAELAIDQPEVSKIDEDHHLRRHSKNTTTPHTNTHTHTHNSSNNDDEIYHKILLNTSFSLYNSNMKIGIIGGGWTGCHLALCLVKKGHSVTILERNTDIFEAVSGNFGIRLHKGPHYPRSEKTRERCRITHSKFCASYPDLVVEHEYAVYGLGSIDSLGNPPKVTVDEFTAVCFEDPTCKLIDLENSEYRNLLMATDMEEPSIAVGNRLRETFRRYLQEAGVTIITNYEVTKLHETFTTNMTLVGIKNKRKVTYEFEKVINASGYNSVLLNSSIGANFPFSMATVYQPCIALEYIDTQPTSDKPFSFIVMDGWFPCIMPYIEEFDGDTVNTTYTAEGLPQRKYILTHGAYTIMASCTTPSEAYGILNNITDEFVRDKVKPLCEKEINRFWPQFGSRFRYVSWKGEVLCKLKTQREFRGCVTYAGPYGVIHVIPGKISNIFDAEEETMALIDQVPGTISVSNGYSYMTGGVLDHASQEITEAPTGYNTSFLETFRDLNEASLPLPAPPHPEEPCGQASGGRVTEDEGRDEEGNEDRSRSRSTSAPVLFAMT
jgi:hypothetical protein